MLSDKNFTLPSLLDSVGDQMWISLREALVPHPGELGRGREEVVRQFLAKHLPRRYSVSTGFVFDSSGEVSRQMDLVIYDSLECPAFETLGGIHFFPCESVVCVGQIKSSITSAAQMADAFDNITSVKTLDRSAQGNNYNRKTREYIDQRANHLDQIFGFVFVSGRCLDVRSARAALDHHYNHADNHTVTNLVFAFDNYLLTYHCNDGICPNPLHANGIGEVSGAQRALLLQWFLYLVSRAVAATSVPWFEYAEYLGALPRHGARRHPFSKETGDRTGEHRRTDC